MIGFIGLGTQEILLLGLMGGLGAVVVLVLVLIGRSSGGSRSRVAALEEENRRLREELDRDRRG